jgi:hypothetical protein
MQRSEFEFSYLLFYPEAWVQASHDPSSHPFGVRCLCVYFCDKECQKSGWASHKSACKKSQKSDKKWLEGVDVLKIKRGPSACFQLLLHALHCRFVVEIESVGSFLNVILSTQISQRSQRSRFKFLQLKLLFKFSQINC